MQKTLPVLDIWTRNFIAKQTLRNKDMSFKQIFWILGIAGFAIFITYHISIVYNNASVENYPLNVQFHCVHYNETNICLENCGTSSKDGHECNVNDFCISKDKMCNGVLDLFKIQSNYSKFSIISTGSIKRTGFQNLQSFLLNVPYDLKISHVLVKNFVKFKVILS